MIFELKVQTYNIYPTYRLTSKHTQIIHHDGLITRNSLNKFYKDKHNLECMDSINHIKMLDQHYDDIPRYTKPLYGDKFPHININIPM